VIRAREVAVQTRTKIVNAVRGMVKSTGHRLPASPTLTFARKASDACPEALQPALAPLIRLVHTLTDDIAAYDRLVVEKARAYPETAAIQTIHGVGALTAVAFVLVLNNDRSRFTRSRDVGCYLGLKPKQRESGMRSPQLGSLLLKSTFPTSMHAKNSVTNPSSPRFALAKSAALVPILTF